jgi:hypothetical protein
MVLARVADFFTTAGSASNLVDDTRRNETSTMQRVGSSVAGAVGRAVEEEIDAEAARPPYLHVRMPSMT